MLDLILSKKQSNIEIAKRVLGEGFEQFLKDNIDEIVHKGFTFEYNNESWTPIEFKTDKFSLSIYPTQGRRILFISLHNYILESCILSEQVLKEKLIELLMNNY